MLVRVPLAVVLALGFAVPVVAEDKKAEADLKAMVGNWTVQKAELGGKDITEHLKVLKFEVRAGGKYTAQVGEQKDDGAFTIDTGKTPKQMTVKPTAGPNKGQTVKAIYKIDADTFTICYDHEADKGDYPKAFETKPDTTLLLVVYTREKK